MVSKAAKKYQKFLYITKDVRMNQLVKDSIENDSSYRANRKSKYPYNCVSKYFPLERTLNRNDRVQLVLPCGFSVGSTWGALRRCWRYYKIAKKQNDEPHMREFATRIQKLETELGIPTASFPNLGLMGDIFFLYDKQKEGELRQQYAYDNVICDRFGVDSVDQLVEQGKAVICHSKSELRYYQDKEHYAELAKVMSGWAFNDKTQSFVKASKRKWEQRERLKIEIKAIKEELDSLRSTSTNPKNPRYQRRAELLQQKILKESELESVKAIELVKTDKGWKYAKQILLDWKRKKLLLNHTPRYYLTDLKGHRLADYKEENEMGYVNDPYFYRLYLEDKEWEKIYSKESKI